MRCLMPLRRPIPGLGGEGATARWKRTRGATRCHPTGDWRTTGLIQRCDQINFDLLILHGEGRHMPGIGGGTGCASWSQIATGISGLNSLGFCMGLHARQHSDGHHSPFLPSCSGRQAAARSLLSPRSTHWVSCGCPCCSWWQYSTWATTGVK